MSYYLQKMQNLSRHKGELSQSDRQTDRHKKEASMGYIKATYIHSKFSYIPALPHKPVCRGRVEAPALRLETHS